MVLVVRRECSVVSIMCVVCSVFRVCVSTGKRGVGCVTRVLSRIRHAYCVFGVPCVCPRRRERGKGNRGFGVSVCQLYVIDELGMVLKCMYSSCRHTSTRTRCRPARALLAASCAAPWRSMRDSNRVSVPCESRCLVHRHPKLTDVTQNAADDWRIAYIHTPKTGGSSVARAIAQAQVAACIVQTAGTGLCPCGKPRNADCLARPRVVMAERPFGTMSAEYVRPTGHRKWLWVAVVREPRSWFFSAIAQYCMGTNVGRHSRRCKAGTTAADLLAAGWFASRGPFRPPRRRNDSDTSRDGCTQSADAAPLRDSVCPHAP